MFVLLIMNSLHFDQFKVNMSLEICIEKQDKKILRNNIHFFCSIIRSYSKSYFLITGVGSYSSLKPFFVKLNTHCQIHKLLEITWPFDFDARIVFRSADFVKYFVILSVNFEPLCIGLIMSTSAVKGDRKREIGQSPIKKKFRDSTISREDIDDAIANGIKLAFKEQQSTLDSVVTSAVRDAVDSMLIPALRELREDIQATNNSVKELREEFEAAAAKQTRDRIDSVQADAREDRRDSHGLKKSARATHREDDGYGG